MSDFITKVRTATGDKQIDYNALANKPDLSGFAKTDDINNLYTKEQTLAAATKTLYGLTDGAVPNDILSKLAQSLLYSNGNMSDVQGHTITLPGVKIATGSYVGTGTYGASNPCSLTFVKKQHVSCTKYYYSNIARRVA